MTEETIYIRGTDRIGDTVMSLPAINLIREHYSGCRTILTASPAAFSLVKKLNIADEVIEYSPRWPFPRQLKFASTIRKKNASRAVLISGSLNAAIISRIAGIGEVFGIKSDNRNFLLTRSTSIEGVVHQVGSYFRILDLLGIKYTRSDMVPAIKIREEEGWGHTYQKKNIALFPFARDNLNKTWPIENYLSLVKKLRKHDKELNFYIFGGSGEAGMMEKAGFDTQGVTDLVGKTNLWEAAQIIERCRFAISNDTGLMHLAAALGVRIVALFGSTDPAKTGPLGEGHTIISKNACPPCNTAKRCTKNIECMRAITVDEVFEKVHPLIKMI